MALATARAPKTPGKGKGRVATTRPIHKLLSNSNSDTNDIAARLRRQHLERLGMTELRADLVASLAWGALA